jgi:hypothetical protein
MRLTTWSASLDDRVLAVNDRHWGLDAIRDARNTGLNRYGESLDAIVAVWRRNGDLRLKVVPRRAHYCQASASIWPRLDWLGYRTRYYYPGCVSLIPLNRAASRTEPLQHQGAQTLDLFTDNPLLYGSESY